MRVLHLCHQLAPETRGGVESYLDDLIEAQHLAGEEVTVLTGSHQPWPAVGIEALPRGPVPVFRLHRDDLWFDLYSKAWHPGVEAALVEFLQQQQPAVVHIHQWIRLTTNLVELCHQLGMPTVVTLHDYYASCPRAFRLRPDGEACQRPLSPASCRDCVPRYGHETAAELDAGIELFRAQSRAELTMANKVLVAVDATADLLAAALDLPRSRFAVLPLGYRRRFPGQPHLPVPVPGQPFRFAFWGGVAPHKGVRVLVDALRELLASPLPCPVELHVLGGFATPAYEAELRAAAAGLPVCFHGRFATADLRRLQPAVGVFPSTCLETFGIVLDECTELGLPSIVSAHGALGARVGGGGLRVAPGSVAELAAAMRRLLVEPQLWAALRAGLLALPPDPAEHALALRGVYEAAVAAGVTAGAAELAVPMATRAAVLRLQRETALGCLPAPRG